ncbi:DNA-3-methyladenine glycosylase I [Sulfoacidibacillus thermotolerans]|uniref:DNA-3-methyladenine glycosylase I n=1 Tax=Sulfoacidibacillus thermotolerans TaxID=1765684 RepID=A0A2U3D6X7_SULT2|nr:DNA-3-methyladenine glycosylase I [Sulfoacidibacillus thermotolerans]
MLTRCDWVSQDPLSIHYHDEEWGVPVYDDLKLFEFLLLEGFQAGLSWITILKKRESFRCAFDDFIPEKIAAYDEQKIAQLLQDRGIIRNRLKLQAAVENARAYLNIREIYGTFSRYMWSFVDGNPQIHHWHRSEEVPTSSPLSDHMSTELKKQGFRFVGTTICYSFMQATGMVMDHTVDCFRYPILSLAPNVQASDRGDRKHGGTF